MIGFPSKATCISTVALLFAVTGTATAAGLITGAQIKDNTVGSPDLRNNAVATQDIKNNSVTSLAVQDGSLKSVDFAAGELTTGPAGPAGPAGAAGAPGVSGLEIVNVQSASDSVSPKVLTANCPAGKKLVGGGGRIINQAGFVALDESYPVSATSWRLTGTEVNPTIGNWYVNAYAICAVVA